MNKKQALPFENPRFKNWIAVARACQVMQVTMNRALQPLDLKTPHLDIMVNLYRYPGITQQDLARKLLVGRSNISMLLPQMEKRDIVERRNDDRDRRVLRLYLTQQGTDLALKAMTLQAEIIERAMGSSTPEECDQVGVAMRRLMEALDPD